MAERFKDLDQAQKHLLQLQNAANLALLNPQAETFSVRIHADDSVRPGMFLPHPILPGEYKANSVTIRAMKKDIFTAGEELLDLQDATICKSCSTELDRQFWHFCPYCEGHLE